MKRTNANKPLIRAGLKILLLSGLLALCLCATACTSILGNLLGQEPATDVDSDLLVIPGSGNSEDTMHIFEGAVNYTGEVHEGTDIYYVGNGARRNRIIVIDAGHQAEGSAELEPNGPGSDEMKAEVTWGATGKHVGEEHALNLEVALLLRDELISRGYSVVMIRETADVDISNMERAQIANKYSAAAYIRIHANSYEDTTMNGAMTICQSANNPYPDCAAQYEVSHLLSERVLAAYCDEVRSIQKLNVREMDNMTGTNWSQVPTTILEMGFLSNEQDDMYMAIDLFKQQAATGIANGIDTFIALIEIQEQNQSNNGSNSNGNNNNNQDFEYETDAVMADGTEVETLVTVETISSETTATMETMAVVETAGAIDASPAPAQTEAETTPPAPEEAEQETEPSEVEISPDEAT